MITKRTNSCKNPEYSLFTRVQLDDIPRNGLNIKFFATNEELKDLEERLCVEKLKALEAHVNITKMETAGQDFKVRGNLRVQLVQRCVATLEPLHSAIETVISVCFSDGPRTEVEDWEIGLDDEHPPETIVDGMVDVGEAIIQHLVLEIDPFPRSPGLPYLDISSDEKGIKNKPLAGLSGLLDKLEN